jgi:hypothetical protein
MREISPATFQLITVSFSSGLFIGLILFISYRTPTGSAYQ